MDPIDVSPQPASPERAHRVLALGSFGWYLLAGAIFCVLATLSFVWLAAQVFSSRFVTIDDALILWAHRYWGPNLDTVMLVCTTLGGTVVLGLLTTLAAWALLRAGRWIDAAGLVLAAGGGGILNQILKLLYQRIRPDLVDGPFHLTSYSFPSGHAMGALTTYGMLAFIAIRLLRRPVHKFGLGLAAALLVLAIGGSRVYFGVHFPTDVLGGFVAGSIWLVISTIAVLMAEWQAARRARRSKARLRSGNPS